MDERPAGDGASAIALNATEDQILAYIRAGLVDAEIAVRMGLSNGDVKGRVERLAAKMGVESREGLRSGQSPPGEDAVDGDLVEPRESAPRGGVPRLSAVVLAGLIFGAGVVVGVWLSGGAPAEPAAGAATADTRTVPASTPTPSLATPTQARRIEVIDGREMAWAGRMFYVPFAGAPVAEVSNRAAVSAVTLTGDGYMSLSTGWTDWRTVGGNYLLSGTVAGINFDLYYQPGDESTRFITGPSDSVSVYSVERDRSPVVVMYAMGPGGNRHQLHVTESGVLYIELTPIPKTVVLDEATGEALDTSSMVEAGSLPIELSAWAFNICEPGPCVVSRQARVQGEFAPVGGTVTCPDEDFSLPGWENEFRAREGQVLTLDTGEFRLHFWRQAAGVNGVAPGKLDCPDARDVSAGDPLVPAGFYLVSASDPAGEPLDVAVDGQGRLFVGKVERRFGCPCVSGS